MVRNRNPKEQPLASEQAKRNDWREGETILEEKDANGHGLPESERDRATSRGGKSRTGPGGAVPPPD